MAKQRASQGSERFYRSLSTGSRLWLFTAIFFLFAPVGLLSTMRIADPRPAWAVVTHLLLSGLMAVGWAYAFMVNMRLLFLVVPLHVAAIAVVSQIAPSQTSWIGLACVLLIGLGYAFFITFAYREGMKSLRLQTEIRLAQEIHKSLVPEIRTAAARFEFFGRSLPSGEVGGDLVDLVEKNGRHLACVADVTGHGVHAGVVMAMVKSAIRTRLLCEGSLESLPDDLDRVVAEVGGAGMFVTCAFVELDASAVPGPSRAAYALAGHVPVLHYVAAEGAVRRLAEGGLPLGVKSSEDAPCRGWRSLTLAPGDLLVSLTDGLTEVMDSRGRELGLEAFEPMVAHAASAPLPEIYERLIAAARRHGPQRDDQTVLLARHLA